MAETPTFKVQIDYQKPENVESEVPESQEIREVENAGTSTEIAEGDFTLSPVITVTKKEATFTKGDLKLQKVTVTEDIAMEELQNGSQTKISRTVQSTIQRDGKTITRSTSSSESKHEATNKGEKHHEERKSKIPMLKFRQTVEKVRKEKRDRQKKEEEVGKRPRKSSIPKLTKEAKLAMKKYETEEHSKELAAEDEFEKIYEQIVDDKQTDIDDKILAVKLEDPEKLDSKFEELIHSYEDEDDNSRTVYTERFRVSKIPALRRRKADHDSANRLSTLANALRLQNSLRNSKEFPIEDEFGEVKTRTITTRRYGRTSSQEPNKNFETVTTVDTFNNSTVINEDINKGVVKSEQIITKVSEPVISTVTRTETITNMGIVDQIVTSQDEGNVITTKRIVRQSKIGSPVVTKVTKVITSDINVDLDNNNQDMNTSDVVETQRIITKTTNTGTFGVTKEINAEELTHDIIESDTISSNVKNSKKQVTKNAKHTKEIIEIGTPVVSEVKTITKVTTGSYDISLDNAKSEVIKTERIVTGNTAADTQVVTKVGRVTNKGKPDQKIGNTTKIVKEKTNTPEQIEKSVTNISTGNTDIDVTEDSGKMDVTKIQTIVKESKTGIPRLAKQTSISITETNSQQDGFNKEVTKSERFLKEISRDDVLTKVTAIEKGIKNNTSEIHHNVKDSNHYTYGKDIIKTAQMVREITGSGKPVITEVKTITNVTDSSNAKQGGADTEVIKTEIIGKEKATVDTQVLTNVSQVISASKTKGIKSDNPNQDTNEQELKIEKIVKESKISTPVVTKVTVTNMNTASSNIDVVKDSNENDITKIQALVKESKIRVPALNRVTSTDTAETNQDKITKEVIKTQKIITDSRVESPEKIGENTIEKITHIETARTNKINDKNNEEGKRIKEIVSKTTRVANISTSNPESCNIAETKSSENVVLDIRQEIITTEQIIRDGVRIGIPVFTKEIHEPSKGIHEEANKNKDITIKTVVKETIKTTPVLTQVTESQDNVQNIERNKTLEWKTVDDKSKLQSTDINKITDQLQDIKTIRYTGIKNDYTVNTDLTKTNIDTKTSKTFEDNTTNNIDTTVKYDIINRKETTDINTALQDIVNDTPEITILKGNVSRLINKIGERENLNKEIETIKHERIKRLDKMISNFDKVDYKTFSSKDIIVESVKDNNDGDSLVYRKDKDTDRKEVIVLKGTVNRLINKLGSKEVETSSNRSVIIDHDYINEIKNQENIKKSDEISTLKQTENIDQFRSNENQSDSTTIITVFKKEIVDTINTAHDKDSNVNVIGTIAKAEITDSNIITQEKDDSINVDSVTKEHSKERNTDDIVIRGSVTRLINKISTVESTDKTVQDFEDEFPKKKTVLSKIAIFENLEPIETYPRPRVPKSEKEISQLVVKDININEKPRIVDEVLKDGTKISRNDNNNKDVFTKTEVDTSVNIEPIIVNEIWKTSFSKDRKVQNVSVTQTSQETMSLKTYDNQVEIRDMSPEETVIDEVSNIENVRANIYFIPNQDNVQISTDTSNTSNISESKENSKEIYERVKNKYDIYEQNAMSISREISRTESRDYSIKTNTYNVENGLKTVELREEYRFDYPVVKTEDYKDQNDGNNVKYYKDNINIDKINNLTSKEEIRRAKSLAETDLGDAVKGQVHRMVHRIKSVDFDRDVKADKIKEIPRISVLEKIALFEGKAASARIGTTTSRTFRVTKKAFNQVITEEMYQEKIKELELAKTLHGSVREIPYLTLANDAEMPVLALGTALMDPRLCQHIVSTAIDLGYRAIDTAYIYGNEKQVGEAIQAKIKDGTVKREDLFIMSKLWNTFHRSDLVEGACKASLNNLGLTYFDLYMIHSPISFKEGNDPIPKIATVLQYSQHDYLDAWFGMEKLVSKGLTRSIGLSNFNSAQIQRILDKGRVKPVVNQVECHPYLSQQRLHEYCKARNIILSCFGVLGSKGTPAEYKSSLAPVIDDPLVQVMAHGLNVTPAQLLVRYQIQSGHNVVVKSSTGAHLWDNLLPLNFTLTEGQMEALHALNRNKRIFTFAGMGDTHKNYPFSTLY